MAEGPEGDGTEEAPKKEVKPKTEPPGDEPPEKKAPDIEDVDAYDTEELKRELEASRLPPPPPSPEKSPEDILDEIKREREALERERAQLQGEKEKKGEGEQKEEKKKEKEEEKTEKPKEIKSFAQERRKRKELQRIMDYLFVGEYVLLILLIIGLLLNEGISTSPAYFPIESSIYVIFIFYIVLKVEKYLFRYLNMKYSGTIQRKVIGVEHFRGIEIPPLLLNAFILMMFVIPFFLDIIKILLEMLTFEGEIIPLSSNFTFNFTLLLLISFLTSIGWLIFLWRYKESVLAPELKRIAEPFTVEEVFLITHSGLLLSHIGKEIKPEVDDDILSSMLTAVSEFVKDSFSSSKEEGELDELQYGKLRIILEYGRHVYLAAVVRGQESTELRPKMKQVLKNVQRRFGQILQDWDGNLASIRGIEAPLRPLVKLE